MGLTCDSAANADSAGARCGAAPPRPCHDPAMSRYIAFLRGINVGGNVKVPMAGLRAMLADLGYTNVATLLQSGNAVFDATGKPATVGKAIEDRIRADLALDVKVLIRTPAELRAAVENDPFDGVA